MACSRTAVVACMAVLLASAQGFVAPPSAKAFATSGAAAQLPSSSSRSSSRGDVRMATPAAQATSATAATSKAQDPLLLRAARGEEVERVPVWMMRQAGRHMQCYRDLVSKYPTFRERSEIPEVSTMISLQPYNRYKTDGVILFSDILTPLPGMGVDFNIEEKAGPKLEPMRTWDAARKMHPIDPAAACPFVGETLRDLRAEVGNDATVLGFVGCPYTLATYLVEGGTSKEYLEIKKMMFKEPQLLHHMLSSLAGSIGDYANYQIESGAQVVQIFDSWAGHLSPKDYDVFAAPYQRQVVDKIKAAHPEVPIIIYINKSGALLERMATSGVDIVSLDWTVTVPEARKRIGDDIGIQGNLDPAVLFAPHDVIKERTEEILRAAGGRRHVMNLGHGIEAATSEENAEFFINTVKNFRF
ncbi:Uroporphyrinogen decarboxylase chloroplast precursor [Tribonema minus]|uniref:Uroporphyrinogen decarboxylase n=1 Tax=Tribonema minus TaxID=303371 RepID=A0A835YWB2_9STRA|nr:Uroporphyrinogen decarboxylase chloroplast precursor [Tribonema minus]